MGAVALPATGRPVDVEIVTRAHAILSASSAERWLTCTPSARIEEALPDRGSSYATDGTAAHAFSELRLRYLLGQTTKAEYLAAYEGNKVLYAEVTKEWDLSDWESIDSYVNYVMERYEALGGKDGCQIIIEAIVDYSKYAEGGFGTSDALLVSGNLGIIEAIDLKFGKGVAVSATDNPQAKLYTLGGFLGLDAETRKKIKTFRWAIVQPRLSYVGTDECTAAEMRDWAENVVKPAAELAWKGEGKLVPSEKACRFCKAAPTCRGRAKENLLIARRDFRKHMTKDGQFTPDLGKTQLTMEELGDMLPLLDGIMQWARDAKDYALTQVRDNNAKVPGYKLVRGRAIRRWAEDDATVAAAVLGEGVDRAVVYEPVSEPVRSVAQMEKEMGKAEFKAIVVEKLDLVRTPLGTPALVPVEDPRTAMDAVAEAVEAFK